MATQFIVGDSPARRPRWRPVGMAAFLMTALWLSFGTARADLQINITEGKSDPMPIAITDFLADRTPDPDLGRKIATVIASNLERSGLFRPIDKRAFIQQTTSLLVLPRFADWRVLAARALVQGAVALQDDGRLRVEFRLWDIFAEQQLVGNAYFTVTENWRRVAHIISDLIYKRITGESGYFDTRIVYVSESGPPDARVKRLAIMDQDGANHVFLTDGDFLVLTPRFSPTTHEITYLSYFGDKARVYIYNIETGQQEVLGDFSGMTFAPRFSPDGSGVIMSLAENGITNIFTMDLATRRITQLTDNPAIDTSPSYSPDGRQVTFNSDRDGTQQLYIMNADGSNVRQITRGRARYSTPVWSPRGDLIAFTKSVNRRFNIGVMRTDGSGERLLAEGYLVEGPTWAPNGRVLAFFRQTPADRRGRGGRYELYSIDLTGYNLRKIVTPLDASDPAWSPLIP